LKVKIKYFSNDELKCKCGCGLLNYVDFFLTKLDVFRHQFGEQLIVNSGCRCKKHNLEIGG